MVCGPLLGAAMCCANAAFTGKARNRSSGNGRHMDGIGLKAI